VDEPPSDADALWGRFAIRSGDEQQTELGTVSSRYRTPGVAFVQLFGPPDRGNGVLLEAADAIADAFRGKALGNGVVTILRATVKDIGRNGAHYQVNVDIG